MPVKKKPIKSKIKNISEQDIKMVYEFAKENLINFREAFLANNDNNNVESADFHYEWSKILLTQDDSFAIQSFRESAKTQYILRTFPLYMLTFPKKKWDYIVLIKNTQSQASAKLKELITETTTNPFIANKIIKIFQQTEKRFHLEILGDDNQVYNVMIEAFGKGASIRGLSFQDRRPKIIICDDLQDIEDVRGDKIHNADWNWFLSDIAFLGKESRILIIGNNLGEKCVIERIFREQEQMKSFKFICIRQPILDKSGNSTWDARYSKEDIQAEMDDYRKRGKIDIFYRERLCKAISDESRTFKDKDFRYYDTTNIKKIMYNSNIFMTIDPSWSMKSDADPRAIVVNAVDKDNRWFILDIYYGKIMPFDMIEKIFELYRKYKPVVIGMEQLGMWESFIYEKQRKENTFFNIKELKASYHKESRIKELLQPRFNAHTIFFPQRAWWLTETINQLYSFPQGLHDDIIDALAYQTQIAYAPIYNSAGTDYMEIVSGLNLLSV